jgi:predicted permease
LENLLFAANAVVPVFVLIAVGVCVRLGGILDDEAVGRLSKLAFVVAMPVLVFLVIAKADVAEVWDTKTLLAFLGGVTVALLAGLLVARLAGMDAVRTGTFVVACHRSNLVIVGLAVVESAYGREKWLAPAGMLAATAVLTYNLLAVVCLTLPHHSPRGGRNLLRIFLRLTTNPLIIGALAGIAWSLLSARCGLVIPRFLAQPLDWLRNMCLPLALIAVGASLRPRSLRGGLGRLAAIAGVKLILEPAVALAIIWPLKTGKAYVAAVVVCLSAPTAIATYTMTRAMKGDDELASQAITATTGASVLTMAAWLLVLQAMGVTPPVAGP